MGKSPVRRNQAAAARAETASALRAEGLSWDQVAARAGFAHGTNAQRAVRSFLGSSPVPDRDAAREVWMERLEALWLEAWADVLDRRPGAVRAAAAVAQRAASMGGLDAPTTIAITPTAERFEQAVAMLVATQQRTSDEAVEGDVFADWPEDDDDRGAHNAPAALTE